MRLAGPIDTCHSTAVKPTPTVTLRTAGTRATVRHTLFSYLAKKIKNVIGIGITEARFHLQTSREDNICGLFNTLLMTAVMTQPPHLLSEHH